MTWLTTLPTRLWRLLDERAYEGLLLGLTAVFIGYLTVWLPGPAAGLSFIGLEMGEWLKFFGVGAQRDYFYLPPITLALLLALWTMRWHNGRWQTWAMRGLAVGISLLAFPAVADLTSAARHEYLLRVQLIGLVIVVAGLSSLAARRRETAVMAWLPWLLMVLVGVIGAVLPAWYYGEIRPYFSQVMGVPLGIGPGVWLNTIGHLLVALIALRQLALTQKGDAWHRPFTVKSGK
ncbi:MAG: hypothetical protein R6X32_19850 [Chloroflexota bacterium]